MTFKKEPAASAAAFPSQRTSWGFLQSLVSIKQEKPADPEEQPSHHHHHHHHYGGLFAGAEERSPGLGGGEGGSHGVIQDLSLLHQHAQQQPAQHHRDVLLSSGSRTDEHGNQEPKQDANVKKAKRPKPESQGIKAKRKPSASSKPLVGEGEGAVLSPSQKPHICDHCSAAFRSSYHLRRHVLIHTGERPFQCSQCSMGFIQKYLLQQAFEKSTNAGFTLGHGFQFVSLSSPLHNHTLFPEKQIYTTSPLECGFGQSVTSVLPSSLPKPPFGMLFGSQPGLYLSALDATHQQLTPSQELDDLIDSQKNLETSSAFQSSSQKLTPSRLGLVFVLNFLKFWAFLFLLPVLMVSILE